MGAGGLYFLEVTEVETATASASTSDIVFVVMDTLRPDHTSTCAHELSTTPYLDALAAEVVRYARARATSSWTWPSNAF
ncbi:MAG: hypothetical protein P8N31_12935 [Planctomycetota bacterium]|nr:hypothetical protein [Planctomycetota bacterium]